MEIEFKDGDKVRVSKIGAGHLRPVKVGDVGWVISTDPHPTSADDILGNLVMVAFPQYQVPRLAWPVDKTDTVPVVRTFHVQGGDRLERLELSTEERVAVNAAAIRRENGNGIDVITNVREGYDRGEGGADPDGG